jgi:hypothetical protein
MRNNKVKAFSLAHVLNHGLIDRFVAGIVVMDVEGINASPRITKAKQFDPRIVPKHH